MIMAKNFEFDKPMKDGLDLFKENMGLLIGASLVASLLSVFTLLIISGPMTVGILLVVRQCLKDKQNKPQIGDLFKGFSSFLNSFLFTLIFVVLSLILGMIPVIGQLISFFLCAFYWWGMMFIAFENLSVGAAINKLIEETKGGDFFLHLLFAFVANLIAGAGILACCVGILFTVPLSYCMMVCCYESTFGKDAKPTAATLDPSVFLK
jgi:hypothetical protein